MDGIKILGTGYSVPEVVISNDDMAKIVDTNDEWIRTRTGIERRHNIPEGKGLTEYGADAALKALRMAGVLPEEIGAVIFATLSSEYLVPATACLIQKELGIPEDALCFDLNAACSGFIFAIHTMECLLNASERKYGLIIGAENLSRLLDMTDRSTCILFGDGAGAAVVKSDPSYTSINAVYGSSGNKDMLYVPGAQSKEPSYIHMDGTNVFKFAVSIIPQCIEKVLAKAGKTTDDVDFYVFHQANARIIDLVVRKYKIPKEKYYKNISEYGNTSAGSIPIVLGELMEQKKIGTGSRVLIVGFGGGLTWGGALVEIGSREG
ncbi:MAG: beta-ketoacyl-ACP synthase III [Eubacteriales bacterium]|nr:beta-ketoacyl-ACP synthase III [Eubacteriales bacterium]